MDDAPGTTPRTTSSGPGAAPRSPRRIVLFADGTGNAYGGEPSNVWRLYQALDLSAPDQIAFYIPGVGTQSVKILRALDAMTGFGVPSNVRKLYRFLCWNWREGDEILLFGFSRGAFTVRALIGLIASQGLVPPVDPATGKSLDHLGMQRLARDAWRGYRKDRAKRPWWSPITPARRIRDAWLAAWSRLARHGDDAIFRRAREARRQNRIDGAPDLRFVGLFDTVQAFGVPIEELRAAIDRTLFPLVFDDDDMSPLVRHARHALSLDDERTTFHPVRIGHAEPGGKTRTDRCEDVEEVWFAGVHSDVGGGYADDALARVPLHWMLDRIAAAPGPSGPLRFDPAATVAQTAAMSPYGPRHDSRSGFGIFYRYAPRSLTPARDPLPRHPGETYGGAPVLHESVVERMLHGCDRYAPVAVPTDVELVATGGRPKAVRATRFAGKTAAGPAIGAPRLHDPDEVWREAADDAIWWRRVAYFASMIALALLVVLPFLASTIADSSWYQGAGDAFGRNEGAAKSGLAPFLQAIAPVVPGWLSPWTTLLETMPFLTLACVAILVGVIRISAALRDTIADRVHAVWFYAGRPKTGLFSTVARALRRPQGPAAALYRRVARRVFPALGVAAIYGLFVLAVLRVDYEIREGYGGLCPAGPPGRPVTREITRADGLFAADSPCWDTGLAVTRDRHYTIRISMRDDRPFFDRTIPVGVDGYTTRSAVHFVAAPLRRWWRADWFRPIARIGSTGADEWPLVAADGAPTPPAAIPDPATGTPLPESLDLAAVVGDPPMGIFDPIPQKAMATAAAEHRARPLRRTFVSRFTATASGNLRLYLNDVVIAVPFLPTVLAFYRNNAGAASVEIREDPDW